MHEAYLVDKDNLIKQKTWKTPKEALIALEKFEDFRDRYFQTETGDPYETADFHKKWIQSILQAIDRKSTSELQSHHDLVCRLLLEKKKKKITKNYKNKNKKKEQTIKKKK